MGDPVGGTQCLGGTSKLGPIACADSNGFAKNGEHALLKGCHYRTGSPVGEYCQHTKFGEAANGGQYVQLGATRWTQVGDEVQGPLTTWASREGEQFAHPATVRSTTTELALKAALHIGGAVCSEGRPVEVLRKQVEELLAPNVLVLHVYLLQNEKLRASCGVR